MSHQPVIDGFEFASAGATLQGVWPLSDFPRLRDVLASCSGEVAYVLRGARDERGRPGLRLGVQGTLQLRCQRCLEATPFEVRADEMLVLAATPDEIHAEPADANAPDCVVAGKQMPVRDLIEDELLLAVPIAPRHESCAVQGAAGDRAERSPFVRLRLLLGGKPDLR